MKTNERLGVVELLTRERSQSFGNESRVTLLKATLGFIKLIEEPLNVDCRQRSKDYAKPANMSYKCLRWKVAIFQASIAFQGISPVV